MIFTLTFVAAASIAEGRRLLAALPSVPVPPEIPPGVAMKFLIKAGIKDLNLKPEKGKLTLRWSDGTINPTKTKDFNINPKPIEN